MNRAKQVKNALSYIAGELVAKSLPFLLLPYLTRNLPYEEFSKVILFNSWLALFVIFTGSGGNVALNKYTKSHPNHHGLIINFLLKIATLHSLLIALICIAIGLDDIYIFAVAAAYFQSLLNITLAISQSKFEANKFVLQQIAYSLLVVVVTIVLIELWGGYYEIRPYSVILALFCSFILGLGINRDLFSLSGVEYKDKLKKSIYIFCITLTPGLFSFFLKNNADKIILEKALDSSVFAVYSASYQLALIIPITLLVVQRIAMPYVFQLLKNNLLHAVTIKKYLVGYLCIMVLLVAIIFLIPSGLYVKVLGEDYANVSSIFPYLAIAQLISGFYMIISIPCIYFEKTLKLSVINLSIVLLHVLAIAYAYFMKDFVPVIYSLAVVNLINFIAIYLFIYSKNVKRHLYES